MLTLSWWVAYHGVDGSSSEALASKLLENIECCLVTCRK